MDWFGLCLAGRMREKKRLTAAAKGADTSSPPGTEKINTKIWPPAPYDGEKGGKKGVVARPTATRTKTGGGEKQTDGDHAGGQKKERRKKKSTKKLWASQRSRKGREKRRDVSAPS